LAKLFIYLSSIISLIRDLIYRMVRIFRFDHMIGENQQYCRRVFKKEENSRSVASCQAIEYNNDLLTRKINRLAHTY